jgi:predicted nucleic acid-binding protein
MKIFLDANYLIYLKYSESDEIFDYCVNLLRKIVKYDLMTNMLAIDEVIWILNRKYKIELDEVFEYIDRLLSFLRVVPIEAEDYDLMKEIMLGYNLKPSDSLHLSSMRRHGASVIVSEDSDFDRVEWVNRMWIGRDYV